MMSKIVNLKRSMLLLLLVLIFGFIDQLGCQIDNFEKGEIIFQNEKREGLINVKNDLLMNRQIEFRSKLSDDSEYYDPSELVAFELINLNTKYHTIDHKYISDEGLQIQSKRFGRVIFESNSLTLYRVELNFDEFEVKYSKEVPEYVYYIKNTIQDDLTKLEIVEKRYTGSSYKIVESYKGALKYLLRDWNNSIQKIDNADFDDPSLASLLKMYSDSRSEESVILLRNNSDLIEKSLLIGTGIGPFALPNTIDQDNGYLFEIKYQFVNKAKKFPTLQLCLDYINIRYIDIGQQNVDEIERIDQFRFTLGLRQDLIKKGKTLAYFRFNVGLLGRTENNQEILETLFPTYNFGAGVRYNSLYLDIGLDRITYTNLASYLPMLRIGYEIKL